MDENNTMIPNGTTPDTTSTSASTDYVIGGPTTPATEATPAVESTPAAAPASVVEATPAAEPTPVAASSTADIYEKANNAAINPTAEPVAETPIYATSEPAKNPMASYSVPAAPTYASSDSTYTNTTYSNTTYSSASEAPASTGLAIASLILGILSIISSCCCCFGGIFSIPGIICGCLQKPNEEGKKPGMAIGGIITSIVGILIALGSVIVLIALGGLEDIDSFY